MMKILFVENQPRFASIAIKTYLSAHDVAVVPTLAAARQALANDKFDAVLVDYDLDDGKGAELVLEMPPSDERPEIIAISSHATGNQALMDAGADAVCSKMNFSEITAMLPELRSSN